MLTNLLEYSAAQLELSHQAKERGQALLHELLLFLGYITLQTERNQEILQWGSSPTILQRLCSLPFVYFSDSKCVVVLAFSLFLLLTSSFFRLKAVLFPTLIAGCFGNSKNKMIVDQELSMDMLLVFLRDQQASQPPAASSSSSSPAPANGNATRKERDAPAPRRPTSPTVHARFRLENRVPSTCWSEAAQFLQPSQ